MNREGLATRIRPHLALLYPRDQENVCRDLIDLAEEYEPAVSSPTGQVDESTAYLITYGDAIRRAGESPLVTLRRVLEEWVGTAITDVHLLPIYPWTSDDGFAVVDHRRVDPSVGTWDDVTSLSKERGVMLDFVANHVSSTSAWFEGWLAENSRYADYFIQEDPGFDTRLVVRPRTTPLFHSYRRPGDGHVRAWTTFGRDQVDVNVANPAVLLDLTDVLLGYLARGATGLRLDAIGFLCKESGTSCLHLPQTHAVVQIWRALIDALAPGVLLLTETNVPHAENMSYFGTGNNEAHMVYQFALPPLVQHAFATRSATTLSAWAEQIGPVSDRATWFNFLASHDGIGMRPTEGILSEADRAMLVDRALAHGGRVSMARRPDGTEVPYELNVGYLDMLADPAGRDDDQVIRRGLAAHSILLSMVGVPAIYYHSLFGSTHDTAGMAATGVARRINRQVLDADALAGELAHNPRRRSIFAGVMEMLRARRAEPGFSPFATQEAVHLDARVFALRRAGGTADEVLSITNVSDQQVHLWGISGRNVLTGEQSAEVLTLEPHGFAWLRER